MPMIEARRRNDPERAGNFRVIGRLGAGGFGKVYVADGLGRSGQLVAVKVMQSELAGDPDFRRRFAREIAAIDRVRSDFVPRLKGHGADDEALWLATELVRGPSLHQVVQGSGPLPERTVWCLALGIATALRDIHGAGLVHRDLKPGNVLLVPDRPRIIDFGLAHLTGADHQTASGLPMCSPEYAPPEQRRSLAEAHNPPTDVFTLGGTLLFAATGHPPYGRGRVPSTAPPNLADLPNSLYDVIAQCLCDAEDARPILADLIAYFQLRAGTAADWDGLAFASVLTARITDVINAWQRDLDEVIRLAAAGRTAAGGGSTSPLTDAAALTEMFGRYRDGDRITMPEPALVLPRAREAGGQGADVRWKRGLGDWVRAPVAVAGDRVVAASLGGVIACFAARSGNLLGHANLGAPVRSPVLPPEATSTNWAYAGGADGVLYAIDLASGHHWALLYASSAIDGPPVTVAGHVYVLSADGCVWEIDARASGEPALLCHLGGPALGTLTVADGTIIAASAEGCVYAIDPADRTIRWRQPTGGLVFGAPAVGAGWLYLAGTDGQLWSVRIDGRQHATLDIGAPVHAAVVHDQGRLYVGGADGRIRAFNVAEGFAAEPALLWTSPEIGGEVGGMAARGGTVVAAAGRTLTVLDRASGSRRAWWSAGTLITAAPVIAEDLIYIASLDGAVSCLSLANSPAAGTSNSLLKWHEFRLAGNSLAPVPSAYT